MVGQARASDANQGAGRAARRSFWIRSIVRIITQPVETLPMSMLKKVVACLPLAVLGGCAHSGAPLGGSPSVANGYAVVTGASGNRVGTASLTQGATGTVRVRMHVQGLTPGAHGVHFHAVGSCVAPAFASAGGHFNPESKHHGLDNPAGPHAGDLPNMTVDALGNADYDATTNRVSLTPGANTVSYTHLRAHETGRNLVCRLLLE